mmetsp:Transcript_9411/g.27962  ORF Transcript_9411/g.27962 Transcript_9411/m.27962 type:complete len:229 (+) Transcript_9411:861-1547(+)
MVRLGARAEAAAAVEVQKVVACVLGAGDHLERRERVRLPLAASGHARQGHGVARVRAKAAHHRDVPRAAVGHKLGVRRRRAVERADGAAVGGSEAADEEDEGGGDEAAASRRRAVLGRENARLEVDGGDVAEGEDDDGHPVEEDCVRDGVVRIRVTHALGDGVLVAERVAGRDTGRAREVVVDVGGANEEAEITEAALHDVGVSHREHAARDRVNPDGAAGDADARVR